MIRRSRWVALFVAFVLVIPGPAPLRAEVSSELVDGRVRDTYRAIRDDAFSPPDLLTLLHHTVLTAQQALVSSGVAEPPPLPVFSGQEAQDLTTAAAYVQAAVGAVPSGAERALAAVLRAMV